MIAFCRRTPCFRSHKIRTFATTKKLHKFTKNLKLIEQSESTSGKKYRLVAVDENIRMLFISYKREVDESSFSVRVGVGSEDDATSRIGMSQLLEHVISNTLFPNLLFEISGKTWFDNTVYSVQAQGSDTQRFFEQLDTLSELMFSSTSIANDELIMSERQQIDGEFHEKRTELGIRMPQIYKSKNIRMAKFPLGSLDTLKGSAESLTNELTERHHLYRKRPVFVCINSPLSLDDIQNACLHNFWIYKNYSEYKKQKESLEGEPGKVESKTKKTGGKRRPRKEPTAKVEKEEGTRAGKTVEAEPRTKKPADKELKGKNRKPKKSGVKEPKIDEPEAKKSIDLNQSETDSPQRLFVVRSDDDSLQLQILFPFPTKLSTKERNTLEILSYSLNSKHVINLEDVLLERFVLITQKKEILDLLECGIDLQ